jgi:DNA phosphorothioation-dependent restriction protein DptG
MYVKLMADYSSDGVWNEQGSMMDRNSLPVSDGLKNLIASWCDWYEHSEFWKDPDERTGTFDTEAFNSRGVLLATLLKMELPDWTVEHRPE